MMEHAPIDKLEPVVCNLCRSGQQHLCFEKAGNLTGQVFRIVRCDDCGMTFVNPRLSARAINDLYSEEYFNGGGFDTSVDYVEAASHTEHPGDAVRAMRRIASVFRAPARILEVGPGMGGFMRLAAEEGYDVHGLELSAFAVEQLRATGLNVMQGVLPRAEIPDHSMDVVVAIEVIEHLPDPMAFFRDVRRILKPGGLFYYETGNVECSEAIRLGADWDYIMPEGHLYYFSPRLMRKFLQHAGFEAAYPHWSNPTRTAFRLLRKIGLCGEDEILPSGMRGVVCRKILAGWDKLVSANDTFPIAIVPK